ncbi:hypothetical protein [Streptomyces sp. NPDC020965]|uniref:hypothetical protein n=1 Tax=Streptomyces sp. NPDC020965 TaxID=3365105 RepID=UPI0037B914A4
MRLSPCFAALAAAVALVVTPPSGPTPSTAAPAPKAQVTEDGSPRLAGAYLNLHQCAYAPFAPSGGNWLTTVVTPSGDGRFATGTNTSDIPDPNDPTSTASCGAGDGNYRPVQPRSGVGALHLTTGRFLSLHQCVYYHQELNDHYTSVVRPRDLGPFSTGTKVSNTPDTLASCGGGFPAERPVPLLSGVKALDLTAGRYVNLHQCVYYARSADDHFTTVTPSRDGRFTTGTNISNTPDPRPSCGAGDGNFVLIPLLSAARAISLI